MRERSHSTLPVHVSVNLMSHEGTPVRSKEGSSATEGSAARERSSTVESSDQLTQLLEEVRQLREG